MKQPAKKRTSKSQPKLAQGKADEADSRDRQATEDQLLAAARKLLDQEGVLSGLNLAQVADEAGVNRGLIYQYFGSRRELLRAALGEQAWRELPIFSETGRDLPFRQWRAQLFKDAITHSRFMKLSALLSLDGDPNVKLWPELPRVIKAMERDVDSGELPEDIDLLALHTIISSIIRGYNVFREAFSRELKINQTELDARVFDLFCTLLNDISGQSQSRPPVTKRKTSI